MRFKSPKVDGYQIFAVSGTNTISFGIDFENADTKGMLGFAVERSDPKAHERYFVFGFKVFPSVVPNPSQDTAVKTVDQPIQSFVWDDFTAKPSRAYKYFFHPLKGTPKNLDRRARPISIEVRTSRRAPAWRTTARTHLDRDRSRTAVEILGRALQGMKKVFVRAARLGCEVVPHETLDRLVECLHRRVLAGIGDDGRKHLEAKDEVSFVGLGIAAFDREPEHALGVRVLEVDAERDRVRSGDREDLIPIHLRRLEPHASSPTGLAHRVAERKSVDDTQSGPGRCPPRASPNPLGILVGDEGQGESE